MNQPNCENNNSRVKDIEFSESVTNSLTLHNNNIFYVSWMVGSVGLCADNTSRVGRNQAKQ